MIDIDKQTIRDAVDVDRIDAILKGCAVASFAGFQRVLQILALGNVLVDAENTDRVAARIAQRHFGSAQPNGLTIRRALRLVVR